MHGNKAKLKRPSLALLRCKSRFEIFKFGLIAVRINFFEFLSLALLRCKLSFKFSSMAYCRANRLGLINVDQFSFQVQGKFLPCGIPEFSTTGSMSMIVSSSR